MPSKPEERLDRRDFMIASIARSAHRLLSWSMLVLERPELGDFLCQPGTRSPSATVYTGDTIQGKKVVSALTSSTWSPGRSTFCIFRAFRCPPDSAGMCP